MAMSLWPRFFGLPCTEWRRINLTIQTFNRIYANLHKITPLTLVAHRQIRRQDRKAVHFILHFTSLVINILRDVIDNMKTRPLTSAFLCARICGTRKWAAE